MTVREKVRSLFREKQKHLLSFEFRIDACFAVLCVSHYSFKSGESQRRTVTVWAKLYGFILFGGRICPAVDGSTGIWYGFLETWISICGECIKVPEHLKTIEVLAAE